MSEDTSQKYKELLDHHTSSTSAQIAAQDIQSYFTTAKFGDGVAPNAHLLASGTNIEMGIDTSP